MRREDGRLDPARIGGPGAAVGDTLVWDGMRWVPGAAGGDSDHASTGTDSTAVGAGSSGGDYGGSAFGVDAVAGDGGIAIGWVAFDAGYNITIGSNAQSTLFGGSSILIGNSSDSDGDRCVVIGDNASMTGSQQFSVVIGQNASCSASRAVVIGRNANVTDDDTGLIKVDAFEVQASSGTGNQTWIVLTDSAFTRWKIGVDTSGNPIGLGAA